MKPSLLAAHNRLAQIVTFLSHPTKLISTISKHHELAPHIMNRTVLLVGRCKWNSISKFTLY